MDSNLKSIDKIRRQVEEMREGMSYLEQEKMLSKYLKMAEALDDVRSLTGFRDSKEWVIQTAARVGKVGDLHTEGPGRLAAIELKSRSAIAEVAGDL